jgi:N-acetyl-S-(2-succino)cysteine monooxygenase
MRRQTQRKVWTVPNRNDQMNLVLFFNPVGRFSHSWRRLGSGAENLLSVELPKLSAQMAERAKFDAIFLSDKLWYDGNIRNPESDPYEPLTTLGALSVLTDRIGLLATISTTFTQPYSVARMLANLDFLSSGRAGWNVVTSFDGGHNFSVTMPDKSARYAQAEEFLSVVRMLWDAWDDDAVVFDRVQGAWADPNKVHPLHYDGQLYQIRDALTMPRSPQGHPVIVQAGQSPDGVSFAARNAEIVFTSQNERETAQGFYRNLKERAAGLGRDSARLRVIPGVIPYVGETRAEAEDIANEVGDLIQTDLGLADISKQLVGTDLSGLELDEPIPPERLPTIEEAAASKVFSASRYPNLYRIVTEERPTLRELIRTRAKSASHLMLRGSAGDVADTMQVWFETYACDGFVITPPYMPEGLGRVCELLVPELQERGLFRAEYPGTTLRDTLGLERPTPDRPARETDVAAR